MGSQRKKKPIPPPLIINGVMEVTTFTPDALTEFAILATSPRSPLMQKSLPIRKRAFSFSAAESLHTYARPPLTPPPGILSPPPSQTSSSSLNSSMEDIDPRDIRVASLSPFPLSPNKSSSSDDLSSHLWPTAVWRCFIKGTKIRFTSDPEQCWQLAEDLGVKESLANKAELNLRPYYAPFGLRLKKINGLCHLHRLSADISHVKLHFSPDVQNQPEFDAECVVDHPFYVKDKGWSSLHSELTSIHYGIPCCSLEVNDVCLPPTHPSATFSSEIFESFRSFHFTPEDTSAVFTLSNMARLKHDVQGPTLTSPPTSPTKRLDRGDSFRPKRPMNAFMLFAKKHRVEYTQLYPGKDNRAISVLLGDTWKRMALEERSIYAEEARLLAEEQKKLYPDCWKRKRSTSASS